MTRNSRRFLCFVLAAVMLAAFLPAVLPGSSANADNSAGITTKYNVNFRSGPSMGNPYLFRLPINTVCIVKGEVTANGYHWYEVIAKDPESKDNREYTGYIRADCFRLLTDAEAASYGITVTTPTPTPEVTPAPGEEATPTATAETPTDTPADENTYGTVNAGGVNFRVAPWKAVIQQLDRGTQVKLLTIPSVISRETWYEVEYQGTRGYIMAVYITPNGSGTGPVITSAPVVTAVPANYDSEALGYVMTIKGSVNIRASIGGTSLTTVGIYQTFPYLLTPVRRGNYTWYFVKVSATLKGYIRGDCVKIVSGPSGGGSGTPVTAAPVVTATPSPQTDTPTGYVKTTMDAVNVRKGIWGDRISIVKKGGTVFPYYGTPQLSGKTKWYYIYSPEFGFAYIHGGFVTETDESGAAITPAPATPTPTPSPTPTGSSFTPTPTPGTTTPTGYVKTTMDDVNVRKGIWGDRVSIVKKGGTVFPYYGAPRLSGSTKWYYIYSADFGYAYIHGGYVKETDESGTVITPAPATATPTASPADVTPGPTVSPITPGGSNEASYTTLKNGSSGTAVKNLVQELINQGYYKGNVTSNYTSAVENAVRAFQKDKGLAVDGIAGSDTQHALFNTVPIGTADRDNLTMTIYPAEKIDWNTGGIQELWPRGSNFKVYDVYTGIVWWAHRWAGGLHIDAEPLTAADTARLCKIYGVNSASEIKESTHWQRRPCLVTIGTRTFACSLYGVPHNPDGDTIKENNFVGQLCIHFTNSKIHNSKKVDSLHQEAIEYAWLNAPNGHK